MWGAGVLLVAALVALLNYFGMKYYHRFDWTGTKIYSLSDKSLSILDGLDRDVTVTVFLQPGSELYDPTRELLERYAGRSSRVILRFVDPQRNLIEAQRLVDQFQLADLDVVIFEAGADRRVVDASSLADWDYSGMQFGAQPTMTIDEQIECEQAVLASAEFQAALKRHYGIEDTSLVMVDIWSAGNYGSEEDRTRRLARPLCFVRTDATDNGYVRPIEGLRPVVDLNTMQVIRVEEHGKWPLPPGECNYAADRYGSIDNVNGAY